MTVTKEFTRLEKSNVKLTVTIGKDDVRAEYDKMLADYTKSIQLPGFRKGKVPREVLVRKFGDSLKEEALGRIIEQSAEEIFADESLTRTDRPLPYSRPDVQDKPELDLDNDLKFSLVYDVFPTISIGAWQGLEVELPDVSITDEDISAELEAVRERNAIVLDKADGESAVKDDVVTVNYSELNENNEVITGTERLDFAFTLGTSYNYYRFDNEVIGMKKDETKDIEKTYAEDFEDMDLAGKTKKLRITLTALKIRKLPDLDDDLAQDVDEKFKTLDDLKNNIRERFENTAKDRLRNMKNNLLLEKIMENTPVIIPDSMLNLELDSRWRNLARQFNTDTEGLYRILGLRGKKPQDILDEWKPEAIKALHSRMIVETLMEELKLEATDEELDKEIENLGAGSGESAAQIRQYYQSDEMKEYVRDGIKEKKFFDILGEKNTSKPGKSTTYIDLMSNNG